MVVDDQNDQEGDDSIPDKWVNQILEKLNPQRRGFGFANALRVYPPSTGTTGTCGGV